MLSEYLFSLLGPTRRVCILQHFLYRRNCPSGYLAGSSHRSPYTGRRRRPVPCRCSRRRLPACCADPATQFTSAARFLAAGSEVPWRCCRRLGTGRGSLPLLPGRQAHLLPATILHAAFRFTIRSFSWSNGIR